MPEDSGSPQDTPPRTTGGNWRWEPPRPEELQAMMPGYTIERLLGRGGMGAVYKGMQNSLERPVAIKMLPPGLDREDASFTDRFKNEAKIMARLNHPTIVSVIDFGQTSAGQLFIVMEYVDGTDISRMIAQQKHLPPEHALAIAAHVCDALAVAHDAGIVHRDIKPANVLINQQGQVKVADFGLAKLEEPGSHGLTKTGMAMGTPDYVAPEALIMGSTIDGRADLYAVGVMLYQMLTGHVPRGAFKPASAQMPGVDPRFDAIVQKAMQMDRQERYQTAVDIRQDLDVILTVPMVKTAAAPKSSTAIRGQTVVPHRSAPKSAPQPQEEVPVRPVPKESSAGMVMALLVVLAVVAGLGWFVLKPPPPPNPFLVVDEPPAADTKPAPKQAASQSVAASSKNAVPKKASPGSTPPNPFEQAATPPVANNAAIPASAKSFGGHRYAKLTNILSYDDARERFRSMGGHLASLTTAAEHDWVIKTFMGGGTYAVWIGGYRDQAGDWKWVSGEPWSFTAWATHPDGKREPLGKENYLVLWSNSALQGWRAVDRKTAAFFIVEWDESSAATSAVASTTKPAETVRPATPMPSPSASTTASTPAGAPVVPTWFLEARKLGGKVRFFGTGPNGTTEKGKAQEFNDVVEVALRAAGWVVRRANGETHGVGWGTPHGSNLGVTPFGPFQVSRITHGAVTGMRISSDGSYRNVWGGNSHKR